MLSSRADAEKQLLIVFEIQDSRLLTTHGMNKDDPMEMQCD